MDVIGHFGFSHDPFRASIEPEQAFPSRPFTLARQQVLAGLTRGARLIAVVGGTGAGKSLLLKALERSIAGSRRVVRLDRADAAPSALASGAEVLLVDDADALDDLTFASLLDHATLPQGPPVVLACAQRCLERLPQALGVLTVPLPFLAPDEARAFLRDRVARADESAELLTPAALDVLTDAGRGIPAALRLLGANALFQAAFDGAGRVEESHARQAAAMTQDMWKGVVAPGPASRPIPAVPPVEVVAPPPVAPIAPPVPQAAAAPAMAAAAPSPSRGRGWWRSAPPLARLAMVVGLLLLALPVIGYVVGAVKDGQASDSSYLPDTGKIAADTNSTAVDEPAPAPDLALPPDSEAQVAATVEPPVEATGQPRDLTASTRMANASPPPAAGPELSPEERGVAPPPDEAPAPPPEPTVAAAEAEQAPPPDVAPASGGPRVFVHYSTQQPGADEAAAEVARELRERGFTIADVRAVPTRIETASVRYFFLDDRTEAETLQDALGEVLRRRGFSAGDLKAMTGYRPSPRRGTLEVWVPAG